MQELPVATDGGGPRPIGATDSSIFSPLTPTMTEWVRTAACSRNG